MRKFLVAAAMASAAIVSAPAQAQIYATGITAAFPDGGGKLPAFNAVPGAGIPSWSNGLAQGVLAHGQYYNYCVSLASATAAGKGEVDFQLARGATVIDSQLIIAKSAFKITADGVWYYCSGYRAVPNSPGDATLSGIVSYWPKGGGAAVRSVIKVPVTVQ